MNLQPHMFSDTKKFLSGFQSGLDLCNHGSSVGKFGFDYAKTELKCANFAMQPQSQLYNFRILKTYRHLLKRNATVLIPICPFDCCLTHYDDAAQYLKYYPILPDELIMFFSPEIKKSVMEYIGSLAEIPDDASLQTDMSITPEKMEENARNFVAAWKREFNIADFEAPLTKANLEKFKISAGILQGTLEYCAGEGLRPILVLLPMTKSMSGKFPPVFRKNYISDYIAAANSVNARVLDYTDTPSLVEDRLFMNALFMNTLGREIFTRQIMNDLFGKHS